MYTQLDFARFYGPDPKDRDEFCRALVSDLKQYGFVKLVNHDVPAADIDQAFQAVSDPPTLDYIMYILANKLFRAAGSSSSL